jgi:hypothetical protein
MFASCGDRKLLLSLARKMVSGRNRHAQEGALDRSELSQPMQTFKNEGPRAAARSLADCLFVLYLDFVCVAPLVLPFSAVNFSVGFESSARTVAAFSLCLAI